MQLGEPFIDGFPLGCGIVLGADVDLPVQPAKGEAGVELLPVSDTQRVAQREALVVEVSIDQCFGGQLQQRNAEQTQAVRAGLLSADIQWSPLVPQLR